MSDKHEWAIRKDEFIFGKETKALADESLSTLNQPQKNGN